MDAALSSEITTSQRILRQSIQSDRHVKVGSTVLVVVVKVVSSRRVIPKPSHSVERIGMSRTVTDSSSNPSHAILSLASSERSQSVQLQRALNSWLSKVKSQSVNFVVLVNEISSMRV